MFCFGKSGFLLHELERVWARSIQMIQFWLMVIWSLRRSCIIEEKKETWGQIDSTFKPSLRLKWHHDFSQCTAIKMDLLVRQASLSSLANVVGCTLPTDKTKSSLKDRTHQIQFPTTTTLCHSTWSWGSREWLGTMATSSRTLGNRITVRWRNEKDVELLRCVHDEKKLEHSFSG